MEKRAMGELQELKEALTELARVTNSQWMQSLNQRKLDELKFHDENRDSSRVEQLDSDTYEKFYGNKKYYASVGKSRAYADEWLKQNVPGKVFLDFACGNGASAIKAAEYG